MGILLFFGVCIALTCFALIGLAETGELQAFVHEGRLSPTATAYATMMLFICDVLVLTVGSVVYGEWFIYRSAPIASLVFLVPWGLSQVRRWLRR